ncbi:MULTISPECIES: hypothetical protein [unclassified Rhodococcus (in: high G+C Gram-positive bacteria)]|uniref:hypothetical protein n=1 Tax=unclassified Rhodococcus (in: high G+C Gram-positive bacteria) TaxID=192944 RepID=UPI0002FA4472|nr:hypothetical protein [Rhodococcus sp. DK17]
MGWLVALVVWTAAGARIGRVAARQPTPLRVAMVVAVSSAALASTLAVPDVAGRLDTVAPGVGLSEIVLELAWTLFAAASAVGAISVWPVLPRPALRAVAVVVYTVAVVLGIGLAGGYPVPALVFIVIALTAVVVTGVRHVAWTPLGRGISLIVVGSAIVLAAAVVGLVRGVSGETWAVGSSPAYTIAAVIVSVGTVWVLVETWLRARQDLRRMNTLHSVLVSRFPEVVEGDGKGSTTVLRASDAVAHVMDALYLQAGAGMLETDEQDLPESAAERARILARWIDDPVASDVLDTEWIAPPQGMSPRRWVLDLADAYADVRKSAPVPAKADTVESVAE